MVQGFGYVLEADACGRGGFSPKLGFPPGEG